jgi:hypothetical protein
MAKTVYFNLVNPQRYFHLVAIKSENNYSLNSYWKDCGVEKQNVFKVETNFSNTLIEYAKYISSIPYHLGDQDYSTNRDNSPPYNYDLFAIHNTELNIFIFGFPFKNLGKVILNGLISNGLTKKSNFIRPDLNELIKKISTITLDTDVFSSEFSLLELILTGETNVSTVILDGDSPLKSSLYKDFFLPKINQDECKLERGSLQCNLNVNEGDLKTNANVHLDLFGNYKVYIHSSGKNIFTLPFLFQSLVKSSFVKYTTVNPLVRLIESNETL